MYFVALMVTPFVDLTQGCLWKKHHGITFVQIIVVSTRKTTILFSEFNCLGQLLSLKQKHYFYAH